MFQTICLLLLILWGCKTPASVEHDTREMESSAGSSAHAPSASFDIHQVQSHLSSSEIPFGALGLVTLTVPLTDPITEQSILEVSGTFDEIHLLFFEVTPKVLEPTKPAKIYQGFVPVPYGRSPGPALVKVSLGSGQGQQSLEIPFKVVDGKYSSEVLHVDPGRVHPKAKNLPRIMREMAEVAAIYKNSDQKKFWSGPFLLPLQSLVTSAFGTRRVYNHQLKNFHTGLDLRAAVGTPIAAAASGRVVLAKDLFYTGNTVMIDHGYGVITLYAHMSALKVQKGDLVTPSQLIGLSGQTGRVNGPHLHWQAVVDGVKVNPLGLTQSFVQ